MDWRSGNVFRPQMYGRLPDEHGRLIDIRDVRYEITHGYAWAIANPRALDWMTEQLDGRGVIEVGAGLGYWAWQLRQRGVDVLASDRFPSSVGGNYYFTAERRVWHPIVHAHGPTIAAQYPDRALFVCWPPYGTNAEMATDSLLAYRAWRGDCLIYCGEGWGGCNAPDEFWEVLHEDWEETGYGPLVSWGGIHDFLAFFRPKRRRSVL